MGIEFFNVSSAVGSKRSLFLSARSFMTQSGVPSEMGLRGREVPKRGDNISCETLEGLVLAAVVKEEGELAETQIDFLPNLVDHLIRRADEATFLETPGFAVIATACDFELRSEILIVLDEDHDGLLAVDERIGVAAYSLTCGPHRGELRFDFAKRVGGAIPDVCVTCDERQRSPLAAASDHNARIGFLYGEESGGGVVELVVHTLECRALLSAEKLDDFAGLIELIAARGDVGARQAKFREFPEIGACAQAEFESAAADHVEGDRHLCKYGWVAKAVAEDELTEAESFGQDGQRRDESPTVQSGHVR